MAAKNDTIRPADCWIDIKEERKRQSKIPQLVEMLTPAVASSTVAPSTVAPTQQTTAPLIQQAAVPLPQTNSGVALFGPRIDPKTTDTFALLAAKQAEDAKRMQGYQMDPTPIAQSRNAEMQYPASYGYSQSNGYGNQPYYGYNQMNNVMPYYGYGNYASQYYGMNQQAIPAQSYYGNVPPTEYTNGTAQHSPLPAANPVTVTTTTTVTNPPINPAVPTATTTSTPVQYERRSIEEDVRKHKAAYEAWRLLTERDLARQYPRYVISVKEKEPNAPDVSKSTNPLQVTSSEASPLSTVVPSSIVEFNRNNEDSIKEITKLHEEIDDLKRRNAKQHSDYLVTEDKLADARSERCLLIRRIDDNSRLDNELLHGVIVQRDLAIKKAEKVDSLELEVMQSKVLKDTYKSENTQLKTMVDQLLTDNDRLENCLSDEIDKRIQLEEERDELFEELTNYRIALSSTISTTK
jgi:hypothetical protein